MAEQWEYKYVQSQRIGQLPDEQDINAFGSQGWELASVVPVTSGMVSTSFYGSVGGGTSTTVTLIFKRRKP